MPMTLLDHEQLQGAIVPSMTREVAPRDPAKRGGRRPRGYLLIEQLMAAGILAATLVVAYAVLARANRDVIHTGHRTAAISAATAKIHELAANPHTIVGITTDTMAGWPESFSMRFSVQTSGLHTSSTPALADADDLHVIWVEVTFPAAKGTDKIVMTRLKRKRV